MSDIKKYSIPLLVFTFGFLLCSLDSRGITFWDTKFFILLFSTLVAASNPKNPAAIAAKIMIILISFVIIYFITTGTFANQQWMAVLGFLGIIILPLSLMAIIVLYAVIVMIISYIKYRQGWLREQGIKDAADWRTAAGQGNAEAQFRLGDAYHKGKGVERDAYEAVKWYRMAAEQGNAEAQFMLGYAYLEGRVVEQDNKEAIKWWRKAAVQGDRDAQWALDKYAK